MALDIAALLQPISADAPCGEDLDGTQAMAVFDSMRIFGQSRPLGDTVPPTDESGGRGAGREFRWRDVLDETEKALATSKDLRILVHGSAAALRTQGLAAFAETLDVAADWLATYWAEVYPRIDEDGFLRANTLGSLADKMAILDALRRAPLASNRQLGTCTIRDLDAPVGAPSEDGVEPPNPSAIFDATPLEELLAVDAAVARSLAALRRIDAAMQEGTNGEAVPTLAPINDLLRKMASTLAKYIAPRQAAEAGGDAAEAGAGGAASGGAPGAIAVGSIRSRQDAIVALDAVAEFFRRNEPASPVPLFVERSKRMISMNFLELLQEVAPGGVAEVRSAAGIRSE